jgi:asparagine synthase (glutamine-hydrolysing)
MAGLCGVVGDADHVETVAADFEWTGEETTTTFHGDSLSVAGSFTSSEEADQPVSLDDDGLLWVWGTIFGYEHDDGYQPRDPLGEPAVTYCADLFDEHSIEAVSGLNGAFVGIYYDRGAGSVSVFTDRLGLRDTYYAQPTDETLVFSTAIQSLSRHPAVTPAFDTEYITEYFTCQHRTFGCRTPVGSCSRRSPLAGTSLFPPASVTTVNTNSLATDTRQYWTPRYRPLDRPFSYFLDEFAERLEDAVTERLRADREYGLLLSGGVDSRLVLAAMAPQIREDLTAYHISGWMGREARTAKQVATTASVDFELLERDRDYHERALSHNPALSNFVGTFEQAHAEGFAGQIESNVDALLTASFADSNFKGHSFPQYDVDIWPVGTIHPPLLRSMDSVDDYIDFWLTDPPPYLQTSADAEAVVRSEIQTTKNGIEHHGITYDSPEELFVCGALTPRTNGSVLFLLQSLRQHLPAWSPFVDNRLIDLYLSMPVKFSVRRNIVAQAIERLDPELSKIPYANTGLAPRYPLVAHLVV